MKKLVLLAVVLCVGFFSFASLTNYGIELGLGLTPSVGITGDYEVFEFEFEARAVGAHIGLNADLIQSPKHDLDIGFGLGVNKNLLLDMLKSLFTLGKAETTWYCTMDFMTKYTYHFNEHSSFFASTGIPFCVGELSSKHFNSDFLLTKSDGLKETGIYAFLFNTKIGYKYTF